MDPKGSLPFLKPRGSFQGSDPRVAEEALCSASERTACPLGCRVLTTSQSVAPQPSPLPPTGPQACADTRAFLLL